MIRFCHLKSANLFSKIFKEEQLQLLKVWRGKRDFRSKQALKVYRVILGSFVGITYKFYFRGKNSRAFDDESKPSLSEKF